MKKLLLTVFLTCIITTAGREVLRLEASSGFYGIDYFKNDTVKSSPVSIYAKTDIPELFETKLQPAVLPAADSVYQDVNGFRLQVFKTGNINEAKKREAMYVENFGEENVILIFENPFYKIRVGRFRNKDEAAEYQNLLSRKGISDTIIIPDVVKVLMPAKKQNN
ncbi:TPA: hypothetical protein DCR49_02940 [Candidatus Delongbacteria bacterium]|nr:MAG: hypothetical protein A2Y39_06895 [Candidatus Delongbacteria bacterium GWF2_40_14]HAQ60944.1 hypothetical protein [Candidatus Delongbacteria bacterium]